VSGKEGGREGGRKGGKGDVPALDDDGGDVSNFFHVPEKVEGGREGGREGERGK